MVKGEVTFEIYCLIVGSDEGQHYSFLELWHVLLLLLQSKMILFCAGFSLLFLNYSCFQEFLFSFKRERFTKITYL